MLWIYWLLLSLKILFTPIIGADEALQVCLAELGCLQGTHMPGYQTEQFDAFLGIPYAKPPVGELRFKNPEPFPAWQANGKLDATKPKPQCLQKNYILHGWPIDGDEDCLYLNLYRPMNAMKKSLPVLFYIHGGGFFSGSIHPGILGPEYFMDSGEVIVVTVAYRLGPFGFLATGDEAMPGNFGLKDQNLALKWVQQHIATFGGDPNAVTICGHSAGGSAVHFHMLYEASKGLFQSAIILSGNAIAPYVAIQKKPLEQARKLAQIVGIASELNSVELASSLRAIDPHVLLNAGDAFKFWHLNPLTTYRPTIEHSNWESAMITEDPEARIKKGNYQQVPHVMGLVANQGEGAVLTVDILETTKLRDELNSNFDQIFTQMLELPPEVPDDVAKMLVNMILDEYFHGVHELNNSTATGFMELFGDVAFYYPFYKTIKHYLNYADLKTNPVFLTLFDYYGPHSYSILYTGGSTTNFGAVHMDDLSYLFRSSLIFPTEFDKNSANARLAKSMVGYYVDFMKNGHNKHFNISKPCNKSDFVDNPHGICEYLLYRNEGDSFKIIKDDHFNLKRMQFWENMLESGK